MILSTNAPRGTIEYSGAIEFDSLRNLLVARNLELTSGKRLRKKSQKLLHHIQDELFIFSR
jgi:hypothetical protein